jgi:hypothetical protein
LSLRQAPAAAAGSPAAAAAVSPLTAGPLAAAAGPFADEPPAISVFSISSVLNDSSSTSGDYRSRISIN